jgi:Flp pilus assembly CpaE family ATPase
MYPLKALLVGCTEVVLPRLRSELSNLAVVIEGEYFDSRSCLTHILESPSAERLIVFHASTVAETTQLEGLNDATSGVPILALVDPASDPSLMLRAMRGGAAQVVRLPIQSDDFRTAMHRIAIQFGHARGQCRTITVLGASEGCGASTIALNLASEIGRLKNSLCILAEESFSFGRLAHSLNIEPLLTIAELLNDIELLDLERVRSALTKVEDNLQVLVGSYRSISPVKPSKADALKLLGIVKQLTDVVVIDGRYTYDEVAFDSIAQSQQIVFVAKPTVSSIQNLMTLLAHFAQRESLAQQFVVINQFDPETETFSVERLSEIIGVPRLHTVASDAKGIRLADALGQTLRNATPHSPALADLTLLAKAVMGIPVEAKPAASFIGAALDRVSHFFQLT